VTKQAPVARLYGIIIIIIPIIAAKQLDTGGQQFGQPSGVVQISFALHATI